MKFAADRPWSDPEKAARKLLEIANAAEAVQDGRIYIELINAPFLFREHATPAEYSAGLKLAIERGWLVLHDSGTYVKFTQAGADLFADSVFFAVSPILAACPDPRLTPAFRPRRPRFLTAPNGGDGDQARSRASQMNGGYQPCKLGRRRRKGQALTAALRSS